jgi:hypothetical protein
VADRARAVIARARETGDLTVLAEVLVTAGSALIDYAPVPERRALARELAELAERKGDGDKLLRARARLAVDAVEVADFAAFESEVDAMLALSLELGHPRYRWRPLLFASMRACMRGRFAESERYLVEVDQLGVLTDDPALPLSLGAHRELRTRDTETVETLLRIASTSERMLAGIPEARTITAVLSAAVYARAGDRARTEHELGIVDSARAVVLGDGTLSHLTAEPAAFAGSPSLCAALRERLEPYIDGEVATGHVPITYEGPVVRLLGLLDGALGERVRAEERLREALERVRRHSLPPWIARISLELAALLERKGANEEARRLAAEGRALAAALGMQALVRAAARSVPPPAAPDEELSLERHGDLWRVGGGARVVIVRDSRGMQLLSRLIEQRGREVHVLVLAGDEQRAALSESDAGEHIDEAALRAYKARLDDISGELDEAESNRDGGRAELLRAERDALEGELRAAVGLGHRTRKAGSVTERARVNVQRRLKDAVSRIEEADVELGRRFATAVRTGTYCAFKL